MNGKLLDERPVFILPSLAVELGLHEAVVVQQLHWILQRDSAEVVDGRRWIRLTYDQWHDQFPWWGESTIRRVFTDLMNLGIVLSRRSGQANNWSLDYDVLAVKTAQSKQSDVLGPSNPSARSEQSPSKRDGERGKETTPAGDALFQLDSEPAATEDAAIQGVWDVYYGLFGDRLRVKALTPARIGMIRKGLKAVGEDPEVLTRAFRGLKSYRESHDPSKDVSIDVVLKTRPGGSNLTDQISWWADQDDGETKAASDPLLSVPEVQRAVVRDRMHHANRLIQGRPLDDAARADAEAAIEWLHSNHGLVGTKTDEGTVKWERR